LYNHFCFELQVCAMLPLAFALQRSEVFLTGIEPDQCPREDAVRTILSTQLNVISSMAKGSTMEAAKIRSGGVAELSSAVLSFVDSLKGTHPNVAPDWPSIARFASAELNEQSAPAIGPDAPATRAVEAVAPVIGSADTLTAVGAVAPIAPARGGAEALRQSLDLKQRTMTAADAKVDTAAAANANAGAQAAAAANAAFERTFAEAEHKRSVLANTRLGFNPMRQQMLMPENNGHAGFSFRSQRESLTAQVEAGVKATSSPGPASNTAAYDPATGLSEPTPECKKTLTSFLGQCVFPPPSSSSSSTENGGGSPQCSTTMNTWLAKCVFDTSAGSKK
jgi:hypothetical protein